MSPLPFINRLARTAEGRSRFSINCTVKYKKPLLSANELAMINSALNARARVAMIYPELIINSLPSINYTIDRQLAGGESF